MRQLDRGTNPIFYRGPLTELTYASWLTENAVRYVALPSALPDSHSYNERALIERGLPYLKQRWSSSDWRVYEVTLPAPIVVSQGRANVQLEQFGSDQLLLRVVRPGSALLRVRWTPYWYFEGGCVQRDGDWTRISTRNKGFALLSIRFSPERVVQRGRRCADWKLGWPGWHVAAGSTPCCRSSCSLAPTTRTAWYAAWWTPTPVPPSRTRATSCTSSSRWACSSSPGLQDWTESHAWLMDACNWIYVNSHFALTTAFLIWLYVKRNEAFYFVRNMFMVSMAIALVGYVTFPTAPPRFMPEWGFTDSVTNAVGEGAAKGASLLYNPYAAVPSMHVAFALMIAVPGVMLVRSRLAKAFWIAYPMVVTFTVVATANHWWLDAVLGALTAGVSALAAKEVLERARPGAWSFRGSTAKVAGVSTTRGRHAGDRARSPHRVAAHPQRHLAHRAGAQRGGRGAGHPGAVRARRASPSSSAR